MKTEGYDLQYLLSHGRIKKLSKSTVIELSIQLIERLRDLHSIGIVHSNINIDNILISNEDPS